MAQTNVRRLAARGLLAVILVTLFSVGLAFGQAQYGMRFNVPYQFTFASRTFPAGAYTFSEDSFGLAMRSANGATAHQLVISHLGGPIDFLQDGALVFGIADGKRILSEVWIPGNDGLLAHRNSKSQARDVLLASALSQTSAVPGKTAFDLTCRRCHGPEGKGNERADKFFNTTIPRLGSADIQAKSDAELKEIITHGTSAMPPVEVDEAGFRHRLPPQDVDAVIAYVRTLKK
jgi:mono/diheme cytochrome c family protein